MNDKKIISLEEVLSKFKKHNDEFKTTLEKEEEIENKGSINSIEKNIENEIKAIKYSTDLKKKSFINELKSGLGEKVKENPNKVKIIEKTWREKFLIKLKNIFTKF